jgi:hypothetical protein
VTSILGKAEYYSSRKKPKLSKSGSAYSIFQMMKAVGGEDVGVGELLCTMELVYSVKDKIDSVSMCHLLYVDSVVFGHKQARLQ